MRSSAGVMSDGNVRVAVRVRPLCARERLAGSNEVISIGEDGRSVLAAPDRHFTFDSVLSPEVGQEAVFEELALPFVDSLLDGFNCTILAYGQTGSGKTYTMGSGLDGLCELTVGIIPRAVKYLMEKLYGMFAVDGSAESGGEFFELYVSFLELYNEDIADLLSPVDRSDRTKRPVLTIREDPLGGICIAGIKEERVRSSEEVLEYLQRGTLGRTTKSTDMNLVSSRSHAIFTLTLRQRRTICDEAGVPFLKNFVSKLHFVDLAGSERLKRTGAVGDRAKESISINSGLLALGNVISALGDESKKATHIPYRDSKLTRLLQDSLGGNSRTVMVACISPSSDNYSETVNTLKYANRARNIKNNATVNEDNAGNAAFEIMQLKKQVSALKAEVLQMRGLGLRREAVATPRRAVSNDEELGRLRNQNRELQRKVETLQKEKINAEAERDFYKSATFPTKRDEKESPKQAIAIIKDYLKTIADLKSKIADLESQSHLSATAASTLDKRRIGNSGPRRRNTPNLPHSPGPTSNEPPSWFNKADAIIDRTRQELQDNASVIAEIRHNTMEEILSGQGRVSDLQVPKEAFVAAVMAQSEVLLGQIQTDQSLKEELIVQIENGKTEYLVMRRRYEERLALIQQNIASVQKERDQALKAVTPREDSRTMRTKYEEKIKKMGRELNEARDRLAEINRDAGNKSAANETLVRNLRSAVQTAKTEKARLQGKVDELVSRLRVGSDGQDAELKELRAKERRSSEQARKYKKAYEFQKTLLQKRIEQYLATKSRVRMLLGALRKHRVPLSPSLGNLLESPSFRNLPLGGSTNNSGGGAITPSRSLLSRSTSAADLNEKTSQLDIAGDSQGSTDDDSKDGMEDNPMGISSTPVHRRKGSLIEVGQPLKVPPGSEVPRSMLRMSPLLPRRKDLFARIADSASLSLATHHLQHLPSWSTSSVASPAASTEALPASPMKIDEDIVNFYHSSPVD